MKRLVLLLFSIVSLTTSLHAYYFRSYQIEDGLSNNSVWAVMQDSEGYMWFGTNDGLNRFDGQSFKVFRKTKNVANSIGNNFIHCLKEDSQGRFLIGTKGGLYIYNKGFENFTHVVLAPKNGLDVSVNAIMEDPDGNIWLATEGFGLYILNPDLTIKKRYIRDNKNPKSIPTNYIWSLTKDYNGGTWLGTVKDGLLFFDSKNETFSKISERQDLKITDPTVFSLFCDAENNIWIGTLSKGLYRYNLRSGKVTNYMRGEVLTIKSIVSYSDKELIMGSDKGLVVFNTAKETHRLLNQESFFDNFTDKSIFSIAKDKEGSFWIGTYFGGVNYYSSAVNKISFYPGYSSYSNSSSFFSIRDIIKDFAEDESGKIWIASNNNGYSLFDPETQSIKTFPHSRNFQNIQSLLAANGQLYFSVFEMGVYTLNPANGNIKRLPGNAFANTNVTEMYQTSKGQIYFSMEDGASYIDSETDIPQRVKELNQIPVKWIEEDYNGALWFATHYQGLIRLSSDGKWTRFLHKTKNNPCLPVNNINCVYQDTRYRLWIGTEGDGLFLYNNKENSFKRISSQDFGLPSYIIHSIIDDSNGSIWVVTSRGIVKIDADLKKIKSFSYIDALQKIHPKCILKTKNNQLYFGGTYGFITFDPKEISFNLQKPKVILTDFQILNKSELPGGDVLKNSISETQKIVLNHKQSTFNIEFSVLSYISPKHNKYAYMLEGYDDDWVYTENNKAYYMNIPAGKYVFRVKGSNNDGVWNELDQNLIIRINPPFWLTGYMITIYILLTLWLGFYLIKRNRKHIEKRNKEKIYKYKTEKEKEIYESKINFFTNIAHEIRTPLSLIIAPLENILTSNHISEQVRSNLDIMKINTNRLLNLVNQLLYFRKIEENMFHFNFKKQNIVNVIHDVYTQYEKSAKIKGIEMTCNIAVEKLECVIDAEAIYKIASNLVSNAIKYAKSRVKLTFYTENENLFFTVEDDGMGIEKTFHSKIFEHFFQIHSKKDKNIQTGSGLGLSLAQSLALKHNGLISVDSEVGKGSVFTLSIPIVSKIDEVDEVKSDAQENHKLAQNSFGGSPQSQIKILVVEDNPDLRSFLTASFDDQHNVYEANNGYEGLDIIEKENIDVIISDIMMPEMDGLEFCDRIKNNIAYSHLPFILLSAKTDTPTKIEGLKIGADVYMEKPFSVEQLKAQINSIIENRNKLRDRFMNSPLQFFSQGMEKNDNTEFIERLNKYIIENITDEKLTIDSLSEEFCMSRSNFHKKIKNITGLTPNDYIKLVRLNQSVQLLVSGKFKINEVCYLVGFNTPSYFSKCFHEQYGKLPKEFVEHLSPSLPKV